MMSRKRTKFCRFAVSTVLAASYTLTAIPAWADDSDDTSAVIFVLENASGTETKRISFPLAEGETYGTSDEDAVSVRDTYYDQKTDTDYDLVAETNENGNPVFYYRTHEDSPLTYTLKLAGEDGTVLKTEEIAVNPENTGDQAAAVDVPSEITVGDTTYTTDESSFTVDYNNTESLSRTIVYKVKESSSSYQITVNYVDQDSGEQIASRTFTVNGKDVSFSAPTVFAETTDGRTAYYQAVDEDSTRISHAVEDGAQTYTVYYQNITEAEGAYTWYIMQYDASDNTCLGIVKKEVQPGKTVTFDPTSENTIDTYTVNKNFSTTLEHTYGDASHVSYVYYDPEGYENTTDLPDREVSVRYVDIATKSVLRTETVTVTSDSDTTINFADSFDLNNVHYVRIDGQSASTEHNYYSPRSTYTVYYRDEANTEFENYVIHTTEVIETTIDQGTTRTVVNPAMTRVTAVNTANGQTTTLAAQDYTGNDIQASDSTESSTDNSTASDDNTDQLIDGIQAEDIDTPQGKIDLKENQNSHTALYAGIGIAAAVTVIILVLFYRRKHKKAEEN